MTINAHKLDHDLYQVDLSSNTYKLSKSELAGLLNHVQSYIDQDNITGFYSFLIQDNLANNLRINNQVSDSFPRAYNYIHEVRKGARLKINFKFRK